MTKIEKWVFAGFVILYIFLYLFCHDEPYYRVVLDIFLLMIAAVTFLFGILCHRKTADSPERIESVLWFIFALCNLSSGLSGILQAAGFLNAASIVSSSCLLMASIIVFRKYKAKWALIVAIIPVLILLENIRYLL